MNDDNNKPYQSTPIPHRGSGSESESLITTVTAASKTQNLNFDFDSFVELEITIPENIYIKEKIESTRVAQQIEQKESETDTVRAQFYSMRHLISAMRMGEIGTSRVFYRQAIFMQDFEDEYDNDKFAPLSTYFPCYQSMTYEQLRTYFTWRAGVRKGSITSISVSYAFVYIYELINNVGVANADEGLSKLFNFWQEFSKHDSTIDKYMIQWLKSYFIYYQPTVAFEEFVTANKIAHLYPTILCYNSNEENSFDIFSEISKYRIKKSIFYTEENIPTFHACFYFILSKLRGAYNKGKSLFEDLVLYTTTQAARWTPFDSAVFVPKVIGEDRRVALSKREVYTYKNSIWKCKAPVISESGRRLVGYILKEMEVHLRRIAGFKRSLSADRDSVPLTILQSLEERGISLTSFIAKAVEEYHTIVNRKEVKVNIKNLENIRNEALVTQEKLIVEEAQPLQEPIAPSLDTVEVSQVSSNSMDEWEKLISSLTDIERGAISIILSGESIAVYASQNNVMLEVLVDGINQKSVDYIGDTILEVADTVTLYEDYAEEVSARM